MSQNTVGSSKDGLKQRLAVIAGRSGHSEQLQRAWRQVHDARVISIDLAVDEEHVDFVSIGCDRFIRFWEHTPDKPTRAFHSWRSYQMPGLAAGYFLHNIVDAIAPLSPTNSGVWFPAEGKEIYSDGETKATWAG